MSSHASVDILEELQLIAAQNLEKLDISKYYEVVRELGKGTYGKVDLVVHKMRGKRRSQNASPPLQELLRVCRPLRRRRPKVFLHPP